MAGGAAVAAGGAVAVEAGPGLGAAAAVLAGAGGAPGGGGRGGRTSQPVVPVTEESGKFLINAAFLSGRRLIWIIHPPV